jgi:hypothetical protein
MIFWRAVTIRFRSHATPEAASAENGVSLRSGRIDTDNLNYVK